MAAAGVHTDRSGPLYFFDQPAGRNRVKGTRSYILNFREQLEAAAKSNQKEALACERSESDKQNLSGDDKPDASSRTFVASNDLDPMDAYRRAAPQLLDELDRLLSQHKWAEKGCIPYGIVNILDESWGDLTEEVSLRLKSKTSKAEVSQKLEQIPPLQACDSEETGERDPCLGRNAGSSEKKSNPHVKKCEQNSTGARSSTAAGFFFSASRCKDPGGIIQLEQPSYDDPQSIRVCQWVVERLQAARNPQNLQTSEQGLSKPLILRHYGDANVQIKKKRGEFKPGTLVNGIPQIPELKLPDPVDHKLHYGINDGSSFIYYPSGCMAVCQSHSGLSCGGFYTNVFSDGQRPVILATITAFGHGAVTDPVSSAVTAVWNQDGGVLYDESGNVTKEWSWQAHRVLRNTTVIQVSDQISVMLSSGTSATLSFKCDHERVHLPLSSVSYKGQSKKKTEEKFMSDAAPNVQLLKEKGGPAGASESKKNLKQTPVGLQMFGEAEVEPSAQWRKQGRAGRELKSLQQRARNIAEGWLDYYRIAIGIGCPPYTDRMPAAPPRTRPRRDVQKTALPSLRTPERTDAKPEESRRKDDFQKGHRLTSEPAERPPDLPVQLQRTPKKGSKKQPLPVTRIGPLQIHGNVDPESVVIPTGHEPETPPLGYSPAHTAAFTPSVPLTVCPALLRAALRGEGQGRACCCSSTVMPAVMDLEFDALVAGQPPHSQQILVVCVTLPHRPVRTHTQPEWDALEDLYRRKNKHRTMPCTQCQMDSFRLLRYEMLTGNAGFGSENVLLQRRHNAAPGAVLMYIRGKLLFVGDISSHDSWDLQRQISRSRRDYRLGVSLPSDYKFSKTVKNPAATERSNTSEAAQSAEKDSKLTAKEQI